MALVEEREGSKIVGVGGGRGKKKKDPGEIAVEIFFRELFELCKCPGLITPPSALRLVRCFAFDARTR